MSDTIKELDWDQPIEVYFSDTDTRYPARVLGTIINGSLTVVAYGQSDNELTMSFNTINGIGVCGASVRNSKCVGYVNIYPTNGVLHKSRHEADFLAGISRIACVRIEYEEGQFDE